MNISENKTTSNKTTKKANVKQVNKNNETVNTQYHKKQGATNNENQKNEKPPAKGGKII